MTNRRAIVWGASGGIGRAFVDALVASGEFGTIYAGSRSPADEAEGTVRPFAFDLLDEASIARGVVHAYREERLVVEGAAAVGIAAILDGRIGLGNGIDGPIVVVVSGANIDISLHLKIISEN